MTGGAAGLGRDDDKDDVPPVLADHVEEVLVLHNDGGQERWEADGGYADVPLLNR
jgi:hypothetical protein